MSLVNIILAEERRLAEERQQHALSDPRSVAYELCSHTMDEMPCDACLAQAERLIAQK